MNSVLELLFRKWFAGLGDAYAVVGEVIVHLGHVLLRHMAGSAVLFGDRASLAGMIRSQRCAPCIRMALEAGMVVVCS